MSISSSLRLLLNHRLIRKTVNPYNSKLLLILWCPVTQAVQFLLVAGGCARLLDADTVPGGQVACVRAQTRRNVGGMESLSA